MYPIELRRNSPTTLDLVTSWTSRTDPRASESHLTSSGSIHSLVNPWQFMGRRLSDRICELCARAVATPEPPELPEIIKELRKAIKEQIRRVRERAATFPVRERRSA